MVERLFGLASSFISTIAIGLQVLFGGATMQVHTPPPSLVAPSEISTSSPTSAALHPAATSSVSIAPKHRAIEKPLENRPQKPSLTPVTPVDPTKLNETVRGAVVNILCTLTTGSTVRTTSGSGVFVDSRGVILTNAHVAQYLLLNDYPSTGATKCLVRTGSPAQAAYSASLLYLPPTWIRNNASQLTSSEAYGTGEDDYAFIAVDSALPGTPPLPASFPALPMSSEVPPLTSPVLLAAYAAGFVGGPTINSNLYTTSTFSTVQGYFTLATSSVDVISVGGSIAAQAGSSGGAVVDAVSGNLVGIIATETSSSTTAGRDLHAITVGYIDRALNKAGLEGLSPFLSTDLFMLSRAYQQNTAPLLRSTLVEVLEKH